MIAKTPFHPHPMQISVKFFAVLKDRSGLSQTMLNLPETSTVSHACAELADRFPAIADFLPRIACAVNREYVPLTTELHDGDELALIPPVSGG